MLHTWRWELPRSEDLVVFFARLMLGFFASALLSGTCYAIGWLFSVSFWMPTPATVSGSAVASIAVGAAIGAYASWLATGVRLWRHLVGGLLAVLAAVGGGVGGLWYGGNVYRTGGLPGIPELSGIMVGAVVAANVMVLGLRLVLWLYSSRPHASEMPVRR